MQVCKVGLMSAYISLFLGGGREVKGWIRVSFDKGVQFIFLVDKVMDPYICFSGFQLNYTFPFSGRVSANNCAN